MKILLLHCDYIKFKPLKKALKNIEDLSEAEKKGEEVKEALVVLTAVEKCDSDVKKSVDELVKNIEDVAKQVGAKNIVLYPYAHLSKDLGSPEIAVEILNEAQKKLSNRFTPKGVPPGGASTSTRPREISKEISTKGKVICAPFGYYKEFEMKVKGHPLSELSREISAGDGPQGGTPKNIQKNIFTRGKEIYDYKQLLREISKTKLDSSKLKDNDHRIIGQQMDLFFFSETAPGMPYWLPNGLIIYNELINFWREVHKENNYQEIATPLINKSEIYKISGHWEHYKDEMFIADMGKDGVYGLKPMNCPNAMMVYRLRPRSYKELPLRFSDIDKLHRHELSGNLNGLLRVQSFQQDDSHNFISSDKIEEEYEHLFSLCEKFYNLFGIKYSFRLGTRPEGFLGDKKTWDKAEASLKKILKNSGKKYAICEGDGAFYGPKVDILMKDSLGREWQMGTFQLDFQLPQRFGLEYIDKDNKRKVPVVVHRVIYGSLERFIGIILEHFNGRLPTWLAPEQVRVLSFTDKNEKYGKKVVEELKKKIPNLRIEGDFRSTTVPAKVKDAEIMRVPYIIVVGDREEKEKKIAVRVRGDKKIQNFGVKEFAGKLGKEIRERI